MTTRPCIAIIPARGGSKGLPNKNVLSFAGLPLLAHSVRCAQMTNAVDRIIVSTDSAEIASIARLAGAEVPFLRPANLADDNTPMMPVVRHAIEALGCEVATVLLLDPTSPGRLPQDIERAHKLLRDVSADGVVAVSQPTFNPFWVGVTTDSGRLVPAFPDAGKFTRRQDVPAFFRINGSLYLWRCAYVQKTATRWSDAWLLPLEIPEARAFSIDTREEFDLAEHLVRSGRLHFPWLK